MRGDAAVADCRMRAEGSGGQRGAEVPTSSLHWTISSHMGGFWGRVDRIK